MVKHVGMLNHVKMLCRDCFPQGSKKCVTEDGRNTLSVFALLGSVYIISSTELPLPMWLLEESESECFIQSTISYACSIPVSRITPLCCSLATGWDATPSRKLWHPVWTLNKDPLYISVRNVATKAIAQCLPTAEEYREFVSKEKE